MNHKKIKGGMHKRPSATKEHIASATTKGGLLAGSGVLGLAAIFGAPASTPSAAPSDDVQLSANFLQTLVKSLISNGDSNVGDGGDAGLLLG